MRKIIERRAFFVLFLIAWVIGLIAINLSWTLIADLAMVALLVVYVVRAETQYVVLKNKK
jgi:hypothetical protein